MAKSQTSQRCRRDLPAHSHVTPPSHIPSRDFRFLLPIVGNQRYYRLLRDGGERFGIFLPLPTPAYVADRREKKKRWIMFLKVISGLGRIT
ncbi:hypothetical protein CEXT_763311 [Caerostris extrusa]|uniref:Uncharacterized protein n=1 Tax=Caerostris extrusa TaxID=172846 RepID=A0AAV4P651_CAEEX|nr:hypothetical protein CEXT_763311 [Caerostris extrusa]